MQILYIHTAILWLYFAFYGRFFKFLTFSFSWKLVFTCILNYASGCPDSIQYLQASDKPTWTVFNSSQNASRSRMCRWEIEAQKEDWIIQLSFAQFYLLSASLTSSGDCVIIYDGDDIQVGGKAVVAELCSRLPDRTYSSSGRFLSVVYRQGDRAGRRYFSFNHTMVPAPSKENSFWTSTVGRTMSFVMLVVMLSACSWLVSCCRRRWTAGHSVRPCTYLKELLTSRCRYFLGALCGWRQRLSGCWAMCINRLRPPAARASTAAYSSRSGTGAGSCSPSGPDLSHPVADSSHGTRVSIFTVSSSTAHTVSVTTHYNDFPPSYFSLTLGHESLVPAEAVETMGSREREEELALPPPLYSTLFPSVLPSDRSLSESRDSVLPIVPSPPPPYDMCAPPPYQPDMSFNNCNSTSHVLDPLSADQQNSTSVGHHDSVL